MNQTIDSSLPASLYTTASVRAMDRHAIDILGISGIELMRRAGQACFDSLCAAWPGARTLSVITGAGNNGGDGFVVARLAHQAGWDVRVYPVVAPECLEGDARTALLEYRNVEGPLADFIPEHFDQAEILVDALLGTGLNRAVEGFHANLIRATHRFRGRIVAVDVPSGLNADTGAIMGTAVKADLTVTFLGLKQGLFTGFGLEHCGRVILSDLDVPPPVQQSVTRTACLLPRLTRGLPRRPRYAHKGDFGHVLVVGGAEGYGGAARLAAEAAARVGAGLVSVATHPANAPLLNLGCPELMCHGVRNTEALAPLLQNATVVVLGPGLRLSDWAYSLWEQVLKSNLPIVLDADGLNFLSGHSVHRNNWVLTPHPGEAARLLGMTSTDIQRNRYAAIRELQDTCGGTVVLKGSGTLILGRDGIPSVCTGGNPGMASGGMGDVLSGVIAGLIAQDLNLDDAAEWGVRLHAAAGDTAAEAGERGLMARDLMNPLRHWVNACAND